MEPVKGYLRPDETIKEAVNKMKVIRRDETGLGVKGLIVVDASGNLVGILSIKDILKAIIPKYMEIAELGEFTWDGMLEEMAKRVADKKVEEIMTKDAITVLEDAPLMECASLMVKHNLQRIPVINKEGKVVGMVYIRDIYYTIVKTLLED
jgi:CBS domain-containing protein